MIFKYENIKQNKVLFHIFRFKTGSYAFFLRTRIDFQYMQKMRFRKELYP